MALTGVLILIPYYYCLFLLRDRLKRKFMFRVEPDDIHQDERDDGK
jgi:hypothetical protein